MKTTIVIAVICLAWLVNNHFQRQANERIKKIEAERDRALDHEQTLRMEILREALKGHQETK